MLQKKNKKIWGIIIALVFLIAGVFLFGSRAVEKLGKRKLVVNSLWAFDKVARLLPIQPDTKKEIETINRLVQYLSQTDNQTRKFLILLQNNMELRPGGGFLGQYAVVTIRNGKVISQFVEDANLLDQRIKTRVAPPYPFRRMMGIKRWKFRDSNFSPDYPENVVKAEYFYRLAGRRSDFDGVIAVNVSVLEKILELIGPITVGGATYNSQNVVLKLEEKVEKAYLYNENLNTQNRKWVIKKMAEIITKRLMSINNLPRFSKLMLEELRNKDILLNFKDPALQASVEAVHWDGSVAKDWGGDYLMAVDANMGALKSDYYIKRNIEYEVDFTGEKPIATLRITYRHTATHGDWRTSDYHTYLRVYVPQGSQLLERKMVSYPNVQEEFNKTYFGFIVHVLIGRETHAMIKYELPENIRVDNYRLLIQKQSGAGLIPVKIRIKTRNGEYFQEGVLKNDLKLELEKNRDG